MDNKKSECLLSEIAKTGGFEVLRNGRFLDLGFLSDPRPGMLAFVESAQQLPVAMRQAGQIACVLTTADLAGQMNGIEGLAVCLDPKRAFFAVHNHLAQKTDFYGPRYP